MKEETVKVFFSLKNFQPKEYQDYGDEMVKVKVPVQQEAKLTFYKSYVSQNNMVSTDEIQVYFKDVKKMILKQNIIFKDEKIAISSKADDEKPYVLHQNNSYIIRKNQKGYFIFYATIMEPQLTLELLKEMDDQESKIKQNKQQSCEEKQDGKRNIKSLLQITSYVEDDGLKTMYESQIIFGCISQNKKEVSIMNKNELKQIKQLEDFSKIFKAKYHKPYLIFLNCCYSEQLFNLLQQELKEVYFIYVDSQIDDNLAIQFSEVFYQNFFSIQDNQNIQKIFEETQLKLSHSYIKSGSSMIEIDNWIKELSKQFTELETYLYTNTKFCDCKEQVINKIMEEYKENQQIWKDIFLDAIQFIGYHNKQSSQLNSDIQNYEQQRHYQLYLQQLTKEQEEQATFNYFNSKDELMKNSSIIKLKEQILNQDFNNIQGISKNDLKSLEFMKHYLKRVQQLFKFLLENENFNDLKEEVDTFSEKIPQLMEYLREKYKQIIDKEDQIKIKQELEQLYQNIQIDYEIFHIIMKISYHNQNIEDIFDTMIQQQKQIEKSNLSNFNDLKEEVDRFSEGIPKLMEYLRQKYKQIKDKEDQIQSELEQQNQDIQIDYESIPNKMKISQNIVDMVINMIYSQKQIKKSNLQNFNNLKKEVDKFSEKIPKLMEYLREKQKQIQDKEDQIQYQLEQLYQNIQIDYESIHNKMKIFYHNQNIDDMVDTMLYQKEQIEKSNLSSEEKEVMINKVFSKCSVLKYVFLFDTLQRFQDGLQTSILIQKKLQEINACLFYDISTINKSLLDFQEGFERIPKIIIIDALYDNSDNTDCFKIQSSKQFQKLEKDDDLYNQINKQNADPSIKLIFLYSKSTKYLELFKKYNIVYLVENNQSKVYEIFQQFILIFLNNLQDKKNENLFTQIYHKSCQEIQESPLFEQKSLKQFQENIKFKRNKDTEIIHINLSKSTEYHSDNDYLLKINESPLENVQSIEFEEQNILKLTINQDLSNETQYDEILNFIQTTHGIQDLKLKILKSHIINREDSGTQINNNFENQNLNQLTSKIQSQEDEAAGDIYQPNKQIDENISQNFNLEGEEKQYKSISKLTNSARSKLLNNANKKSQTQNQGQSYQSQQLNKPNNQEYSNQLQNNLNLQSTTNNNQIQNNVSNQNINTPSHQQLQNSSNNTQDLQIQTLNNIVITKASQNDNLNNQTNQVYEQDVTSLTQNGNQNNQQIQDNLTNISNQNLSHTFQVCLINEDENEDKDDEEEEKQDFKQNVKIKNVEIYDDEEDDEGNI
ncbi:hypothetical protein ABPG74_009326 [Tetrahymena malaccensis]